MAVGVVSLQACRGGKFDYGVESEGTDGGAEAAVDEGAARELMEKQVSDVSFGEMETSSALSLTESLRRLWMRRRLTEATPERLSQQKPTSSWPMPQFLGELWSDKSTFTLISPSSSQLRFLA